MDKILKSDKLKSLTEKINGDSNGVAASKSSSGLNRLEKASGTIPIRNCSVVLQRLPEFSKGDHGKSMGLQKLPKSTAESTRIIPTESTHSKGTFTHSAKLSVPKSKQAQDCSMFNSDLSRLAVGHRSHVPDNSKRVLVPDQPPGGYSRLESHRIGQPSHYSRTAPDQYQRDHAPYLNRMDICDRDDSRQVDDCSRLAQPSVLGRTLDSNYQSMRPYKVFNGHRKAAQKEVETWQDDNGEHDLNTNYTHSYPEHSRLPSDHNMVLTRNAVVQNKMYQDDSRIVSGHRNKTTVIRGHNTRTTGMNSSSSHNPATNRLGVGNSNLMRPVAQLPSIREDTSLALDYRDLRNQATLSTRDESSPLKKKFLVDSRGFLIPQRTETFRLAYHTNHSKQLERDIKILLQWVINNVNKVEAEFYTYCLQKYVLGIVNLQIKKGVVTRDEKMLASMTQLHPSVTTNASANMRNNLDTSVNLHPTSLDDSYDNQDYLAQEITFDSSDEEVHEIHTERRHFSNKRKSTEEIITTNKRVKACPTRGVQRDDQVVHTVTRVVTPMRKPSLNFTMELRSHSKKTQLNKRLKTASKVQHNITKETRFTLTKSRKRQGDMEEGMHTPSTSNTKSRFLLRQTPRRLPHASTYYRYR